MSGGEQEEGLPSNSEEYLRRHLLASEALRKTEDEIVSSTDFFPDRAIPLAVRWAAIKAEVGFYSALMLQQGHRMEGVDVKNAVVGINIETQELQQLALPLYAAEHYGSYSQLRAYILNYGHKLLNSPHQEESLYTAKGQQFVRLADSIPDWGKPVNPLPTSIKPNKGPKSS